MPSPASRAEAARRRAAVVVAALAALGVVALWWVFVTTAPGQRVEEVALEGSTIGRWRLAEGARAVLDVVSVPFLGIVTLAGIVAAVARRRWRLAVAVPLLVGAANVTTQVLKYQVFSRPDLGVAPYHANSLPSGHTTVAASVAAVAVLVAPPRWRWAAALGGWGYAGGTGLATMVNGWHRASDVAAALLVALAWAALALAVAGSPGPRRGHGATRVTTTLLLGAAAATGLLAALALVVTAAGTGPADEQGRAMLLVAYGGACAGVAAVACVSAGVLLWLSTAPAPARRGDGAPRPASARPRP